MSSESMREVGGLQSILLYMLSILVFFHSKLTTEYKEKPLRFAHGTNCWSLTAVKIFSKCCVMRDTT